MNKRIVLFLFGLLFAVLLGIASTPGPFPGHDPQRDKDRGLAWVIDNLRINSAILELGTNVLSSDGGTPSCLTWNGARICASGAGDGVVGCQGTIIRDAPSDPEPPPENQACAERLVFRNGAPILYWDPVRLIWF